MLSADQLLLFIRQVLQEAFWIVGGLVIALVLILYLVYLLQGVFQNVRSQHRR